MTSSARTSDFYVFEGPQTLSLELIPLRVRYKLDCCEIKLHLQQWQTFNLQEKQQLLQLASDSESEIQAYRAYLQRLVETYFKSPVDAHPASGTEVWRLLHNWPEAIVQQCELQGLALPALSYWQGLHEADRHALFILGRSKHSQTEFVQAMRLFCDA